VAAKVFRVVHYYAPARVLQVVPRVLLCSHEGKTQCVTMRLLGCCGWLPWH